jgi:hypothetical protein
MPTDSIPSVPPPPRPTPATAAGQREAWFRRQVWVTAMLIGWGAFELGRWTEAAEPWDFWSVFGGFFGAMMVVSAVFGLRVAVRHLGAGSGVDAPAR